MSRRLAEQGRVMVRVLIGADGLPQKAELQASSGYDRLDRAALDSVMRWRFVPGRRGDVPETMWVSVPIDFKLE
jgi:protein TonB